MRPWTLRCLLALAAIGSAIGALAVGCGVDDEVVAREGSPDGGPAGVVAGQPCASSGECGSDDGGGDYFCSKGSCGAEGGTCEKKPTTCDGVTLPVCGCTTGLLYWSDCLRQQSGESASGTSADDCPARTCTSTDADACPAGSQCALFWPGCVPPTDPRTPPGVCLVLPDQCPTVGLPGGFSFTPPQVVSCRSNACTDYCSAVREGDPILLPTEDAGICR